ncbi:unnamed protein product [Zymoseptoria tritici ST99CH_1A5]|uniref:Mitochondrial pyruvate carrier n=1 Tax=Zymoseptoria tritici ST99CH_1A5 TaxID=1276529 RepID=A0A1Y6L4T5_ZYMTR|nr:unnamed protein product [Zymoseptoria tritici ST99CH_1A5]
MSARFGLRAAQTTFRQPVFQQNVNAHLRFAQRRMQSTVTEAAEAAKATESGLARFLNSPVGPKTVHFWAPIMKWGLVLAGAADFARPADQLSLSQNTALMCTGLIWTRWCFVIKPRNLFLASVNFLLFCVGATQTGRVLRYQASQKGTTVGEEIKDAAKEQGKKIEQAVEKVEAKVSK